MRKLISIVALFMFLFVAFSVSADLSFEQGLSGWTTETRQDSWAYTQHFFTSDIITNRASDGEQSIHLGAHIIGDYSNWWDVDYSQSIVWAGPFNLTRGLSISLDMSDIQRSEPQSYWGWGMEMDLILSDGTNEASALLYDYHEENTGTYGPAGLEDNLYTSIVTGDDGTQWYRYNVPLTDGLLINIDLSAVYVGVSAYAINWNNWWPQNLQINALVDNLTIEYEPIPVTINVNPNTLNRKSKGGDMSITVFTDILFSEVDVSTLTLSGIPATTAMADDNGKLKIKFDRQAIIAIVAPPSATLILKGLTTGGIPIIGADTIKVIH